MTTTPKVAGEKKKKKQVSQSGNTDQQCCFFCHQDPQAVHLKTLTLVTSASSAPPSSSERFSIDDKTARARQGRQKALDARY